LQGHGEQVFSGTSNEIVVATVSGCLCNAVCQLILTILQDLALHSMEALLNECGIKNIHGEKDSEVFNNLKAHCGGLDFVSIIELIVSVLKARTLRKSCLQRAIRELWQQDLVELDDLVKWVDEGFQVSGDEVIRAKTAKFIRQTAELNRTEMKVAEICVFLFAVWQFIMALFRFHQLIVLLSTKISLLKVYGLQALSGFSSTTQLAYKARFLRTCG
jgi:hypothetical protein